ncbi:MAG TPA: molybdopterin-dependent oxidoreductase, partial [Desulfobacteria bacterium]|nr:molybdopterin-dependent oxidoreductase [Desulfobacteria bacterium]
MTIKYTVCPHDCPDTCAWKVELEDGKITKVSGDPDHPVTRGVICSKARHYPERVYGADRILYPLRRTGSKGSGKFTRVSWDEALTEIVERWQELIRLHGAESILPYSYGGTEGIVNKASMDRRFFNKLGATQLERTICGAAGGAGYNLIYGLSQGINPLDSEHAKLIIFWGINALETNLHQAMLAKSARRKGAKIVVIDVHRNRTAKWADDFYHILPGSDGSLALGLAHIIFRDGLTDAAWADKYTNGMSDLARAATDYTPERVSALTGLAPARIEALARLYATTKPSFIRIGNGLQHHDNGGMNTWAIACLPAIVGAWRFQGGGAIKGNDGYFPLNKQALQRPDLRPTPSPRTVNMNQLGLVLTRLAPPVYSLYVYNSNPAVIAPEQALVRQGLAREDLFTVVHEQVWTDTARWADIILPATTHLEHQDLYKSYWHCILQWAEPVIPPLGEAKPNIEVFRELAARMGFVEACFEDSAEQIASQALDLAYWHEQEITFAGLRRKRFIPVNVPEAPFAAGGFSTPSGKAEIRSEKAVQQGFSAVPHHVPLVEGPETANGLYPLTLITPPNRSFLNSTFANLA